MNYVSEKMKQKAAKMQWCKASSEIPGWTSFLVPRKDDKITKSHTGNKVVIGKSSSSSGRPRCEYATESQEISQTRTSRLACRPFQRGAMKPQSQPALHETCEFVRVCANGEWRHDDRAHASER
jgi:hypothetical protein